MGRYDVITHADICFLQMFLLAKFGGIALRLVELKAMEKVEVVVRGARKQRKSAPYITRSWRWTRVKCAENKSLLNVIDEEEFHFCLYIFTPQETSPLGLFYLHNQEIMLSPRDALFLLVVASRIDLATHGD